jgi:hypothetical protein
MMSGADEAAWDVLPETNLQTKEEQYAFIKYKMGEVKKFLMYLETTECRERMTYPQIYEQRKRATELFRAYIFILHKQSDASNTHS